MIQQPDQPVIEIDGLNHYFGSGDARTQALFENKLKVGRGEIVIMTGPSGSGKTTIVHLALKAFEADKICLLSQDDFYIPGE